MRISLVKDLLDKQLLDANGQNAGKVDGIVIELRDGEPARVRHIEVGPITLARRVNHRLGAWIARLDRRFGRGRGEPIRIPISRVIPDSPAVRMDLVVDGTPIMAFEDWLRRKIVKRIPWSS